MVRKAFILVTGISAVLIAAVPSADAQQSAPRVRVTSQPYNALGTIEPTISLSEPAYVLAVGIDRDGRVTVLSPAGPDDLIRFEAAKSLRLPEFFSGFSRARTDYYDGYAARYASYISSVTEDYSAGSVLVIASRTPFNFAAISDGPFWNEEAIRELVRYRDPSSAVYTLGRAVTAKGQSFGHDYLRFGADRYRLATANPCLGVSAYGYSPYGYSSNWRYGLGGYGYMIVQPTAFQPGYQIVHYGTDACGRVRYIVLPLRVLPPRDSVQLDSTDIPKPEFKSSAPGTYTGEAAREIFEMLARRNNSDTYVGMPMSPILKDKEDGPLGRPVSRETSTQRAETFEKVRSASATPIERAPVLRQAPQRQAAPASRPIVRSEPVVRSAPPIQRESKPAEVMSRPKDN